MTKNAIDILRKKVQEVSYPLGKDDRYTDESKDILNLRWLNRVMQDHEARASDLNRKLIFSFFLLFS